jgi:NADPH-dependent curcumin reductase CurA
MPVQAPNPPDSVLDNLQEECQDHEFWSNFRNAAAIIFCGVVDTNNDMRQIRELSFSEELTKTKNMIDGLILKLDENDSNVDVIQISLAVN